MNRRSFGDAIRIPVTLIVAVWLMVFLLMALIEAIWFLDRQF
ncbi:MAG: hypothetical protein R2839_07820 [Thermomicrobiales bacterium]